MSKLLIRYIATLVNMLTECVVTAMRGRDWQTHINNEFGATDHQCKHVLIFDNARTRTQTHVVNDPKILALACSMIHVKTGFKVLFSDGLSWIHLKVNLFKAGFRFGFGFDFEFCHAKVEAVLT